VKHFRYARDGLCVVSCAAYGVNRWLLPVTWKGPFLRNHFDDLLLIPAALPLLLGLQRWLGTRRHDDPPRWAEIGLVLGLWSIAAEFVAPRLTAHAVGDILDVVAYSAGALLAGLWWNRP
jgi:hypothetical protein